jgi:hypothetical protein
MKRPSTKPLEKRCTACDGTGHLVAVKPTKSNVRIYPPQCKVCLGKGRVSGERGLRRPYVLVVGGLALRSWETAVTSCAGANGFGNMMLFGTPLDAQSSASLPLM